MPLNCLSDKSEEIKEFLRNLGVDNNKINTAIQYLKKAVCDCFQLCSAEIGGMKIVVDPGHGNGSGAFSAGFFEDELVLDQGLTLAKLLKNEGYSVILTRDGDYCPSLRDRVDLANNENADLYISLHTDAWSSEGAEGGTIFTYLYVGELTEAAANILHSKIKSVWDKYNIRDRGIKRKNLAVLRDTRMPAVLIENAFITNAHDRKVMVSTDFLTEVAFAIVEGVNEWANYLLQKKEELEAGSG